MESPVLKMKCFLIFLLFILSVPPSLCQKRQKQKQTQNNPDDAAPNYDDDEDGLVNPTPPPEPVRYIPGYRKVSWCVSGYDEPELHAFPYSQFVPLLRRHNREKMSDDVRYDLRFYDIDTHQKDVGNNGKLFKTMHVVFKAFKRRDKMESVKKIWDPLPLEGLIIQANMNPYTIALPTGFFFPAGNITDPTKAEIHCEDCDHVLWGRAVACRKTTKIHVEHPNILAWHHMQDSYDLDSQPPRPPPPVPYDEEVLPPFPPPRVSDGRQTEIHANFRFYSPQCAPVKRLMFQILAVRSFVDHEYDIFHEGPYVVTVRDQNFQSDFHPSPYFYHYTQKSTCHTTSASDITLEHPPRFLDFEMNHFYDCCVREEENLKTKMTIELLGWKNRLSTSCYEKFYKTQEGLFDPRTIETGLESPVCFFPFAPKRCDESERIDDAHNYNPTPCAPCIDPVTTTTEQTTEEPESVYKRTMHGGLMIMTNFCLQPIVIYIARFYKETFNSKSYKGAKLWFLMHVLGGIVSSSMVYLGYFSGGDDTSLDIVPHIATGKVYIMTLAVCYFTAWGRHKNHIINIAAEFIHGCLGYVTITLALYSIWSAPGMEQTSKLFVLLMVCCQGFFMLILTCQICLLDRKIGMRPKRRHFPTVEARFDEITVPGGKFRVVMLIIFSSITFSLSTASTFVK